ncbi:LysR family transcriptional regulator [Tistrella sp. BH-R2-4]|uniref:LysR family transcriptional regulator n=1 Tax=Tistrella arctica TaxID=3133430 RepID=A0ABU9YQH4_9PROT
MIDQLSALAAFMRTAETGSFVAAARVLGVSSSAVGKAVARLEDRLGVRLFHRSTRSITLTAEGQSFLERCRRIFAEIEAAEHDLLQARAAPRGRLRISLPLIGMLVMPVIAGFMRAYPDITLDIDQSDRLVEVIEEGFDAVMRSGDGGDSRLMSRSLGSFRYRIVAAPAYFAAHGRPDSPAALTGHACLHHRYPATGKLEPWPLDPAALGGPLPETLSANTLDPLIQLAEQGLGIICLPDFAVRRQLDDGRLVPVLDSHVGGGGQFRILWPSSRHMSPTLRAFVDYMATHLRLTGPGT